jgi:hypothetical protein
VFTKLKENKIVAGLNQTQQCIVFYFYLDMFRSIDHHQRFALYAPYSKFCEDGLLLVNCRNMASS